MSVKCDKMSQIELNRVQTLIEQMKQDGENPEFEILVDGYPYIKRTDKIERFSNYNLYVNPHTEFIKVILYHGKSNNSQAFEFWLQASDADDAFERSLGHQESQANRNYTKSQREQIIKERKARDSQAEELERLKRELADLKTFREEREKYISQIEEAIEKFKSKGHKQNIELGEILSLSLESFLKRNAELFKDIPVLNGLAGLGNTEKDKEEPQGEASFRKKGDPAPEEQVTLTQEQKEFLKFFSDLQKLFSAQEMVQIFSILESLSRDKNKIQTVLELVR